MKYTLFTRRLPAITPPYLMGLLAVLLFAATTAFAIEEPTSGSKDVPYQSAFEGYRAISKDSLTDWKALNHPSNDSGHSGHQMQGMQHDMQSGEVNSAEHVIEHSKMDHSKMITMKHQHAVNESSTGNMDHSKMEHPSPPSNTAQSNSAAANPHAHDSEIGAQDHDMTQTMPDMGKTLDVNSQPASTDFTVIPNMHPAVVHFPIALTVAALLFSLAAHLLGKHSAAPLLAATGHFTLWLAALSAVVAAIFGWLAFNSGMNHDDAGHAAMLLHRKWAIPTALGLVLLASWDAWKSCVSQVMPVPALLCLLALSGAIATTAWLGAEIVYRHGIGVLSLPSSEGTGHSHQHNGSNKTEHAHEAAKPDEHGTHQHDDTQGGSHEH